MTDQAGTASYSYGLMGRLAAETRLINPGTPLLPVSMTVSYEYNLDGSLSKLHYPSGAIVTYTADAAGRPASAVDTANSINYVTGSGGPGTNATYGPTGAITSFVSGQTAGFPGITSAFTYNNRLQPIDMVASLSPTNQVFSLSYDFHLGNGDNGNVYKITNNKDTTRSQAFTYDALNRLTSARNAGTDCSQPVLGGFKKFWGNTYDYDAWGNLLHKTWLANTCAGENLSVSVGNKNRITTASYAYDPAGNLISDGPSRTYTYDQENRITGAAGYAYTYDADGNRVEKANGTTASSGTLYWYMTPGIVAESDLAGALKSEYVFFGGERVARRDLVTPPECSIISPTT